MGNLTGWLSGVQKQASFFKETYHCRENPAASAIHLGLNYTYFFLGIYTFKMSAPPPPQFPSPSSSMGRHLQILNIIKHNYFSLPVPCGCIQGERLCWSQDHLYFCATCCSRTDDRKSFWNFLLEVLGACRCSLLITNPQAGVYTNKLAGLMIKRSPADVFIWGRGRGVREE